MRTEKQAVLEAATRILAVDPRASTQEIAAAAGISRTTLHRLFPSRDALIEELGVMAVGKITAAFAAAHIEEGTALEALERLVRELIPLVNQFAFLISETQLMRNEAVMASDRALQQIVEGLLRRGQREGALRYDLPVPWMAHALTGLFLAAEEAARLGAIAPRETAHLILESFLGGAAAGRATPHGA
jgi:AcrR family transcriptional regulator